VGVREGFKGVKEDNILRHGALGVWDSLSASDRRWRGGGGPVLDGWPWDGRDRGGSLIG